MQNIYWRSTEVKEKSLRQLIRKGFSYRIIPVAQKDLTLVSRFLFIQDCEQLFYYSIKRIFKCVELSLQACHTLQKRIGYIPYTGFSSWPNREETALICLASREREGRQTEKRQTKEGGEIPELLQEKGSLTFPSCLSANPLSICTPDIQTWLL